MALNVLTIVLIFGVSLVVALAKGIRPVYALIYLPVLILLYQVPPLVLTHVPVESYYAPLYACLIAMPFRQESLRFRPSWVDLVVVLLIVSVAITGFSVDGFEVGVNVFRTDTLRLAVPYFLARIVFKDWQPRRSAVYALSAVMGIVVIAAAIEARMTPAFYQHMLERAGMNNFVLPTYLGRWGLYRVTGTDYQPIFFGNMCLVVLGLVAVLARTSGLRLRNPLVAATLLAALVSLGLSLSFTPYIGLGSGVAALTAFTLVPITRRFILPITLAAIVGGFSYTYYVAVTTSPEDRRAAAGTDSAFEGSRAMRNEIIRQSWPVAASSGAFGRGLHPEFLDIDNFDLVSVDNTYMYFTMTRGWVYTALWLSIGVLFAGRASRAFRRVTDPSQVLPLAICTATVLSLMVSMYTVFAGAVYTILWIVMLGLSNTLIDAVNADADAREGLARPGLARLRPPTVRMPAVAGV